MKETLRTEALRHRAQFNLNDEDPDDAVEIFLQAVKPAPGQIIALYYPKGKEFDVLPLHENLAKQEFTCVLPIVQKEHRIMKFAKWVEGEPLHKSDYGIMEPAISASTEYLDPDIVITPMLAFDRRGTRLGYGGGHYDATLEDLRSRKTITAVGVAYAAQAVLFNLPKEEHDQSLDWVVTPKQAYFYGDF